MLGKVLVAVDGSDHALAALDAAIDRCGTSAQFVVMQVTDPVDRVSSLRSAAFDPELVRSALESLDEEAEQHVAVARKRLLDAGAVQVETVVARGRAGETIVAYAEEGGFDLLVMGTHGRSGLARTLMGSVAEYVVRHLRGVPIFLLRADGER